MVDRIEIVRGVESVLGSDSLGGHEELLLEQAREVAGGILDKQEAEQ